MEESVATITVDKRKRVRWWATGIGKAAIAFAAIYLPLAYFSAHYRLLYAGGGPDTRCLPYSLFLVDIKNHHVERTGYVAFISKQMQPFYKNGTTVVKQLIGVPGDTVTVNEKGVWVEGVYRGELTHLKEGGRLRQLGLKPENYRRHEQVPQRHYWVMGTHPRSFDSRYWGYISDEQIMGRAVPIW